MKKATQEGRYLRTAEMAAKLNYHPLTLVRKAKKLTKDGVFKEGTHYFKSGAAASSPYLWNETEIVKTFSEWRAPSKEVQCDK